MALRRLLLPLVLVFAAFALEAQAGTPAVLPGSSWSGSANLAAKITAPGERSDTTRGPTTFAIAFGPLAVPALSSNEFRLVLDDGSVELEIEGTYSVDSLGRPTLSLTIGNRELTIKARVRKSGAEAMKASGKIDFAFLDAGATVVRVKLRIKGAGITRD